MQGIVIKLVAFLVVVFLVCWVYVLGNLGIWLCGIALLALGALAAVLVEVPETGTEKGHQRRA